MELTQIENAELLLPTDAELLASFTRNRDDVAFAQLVERHGPLVMGVCRQILRHRHDAEEAFQATFLVLALRAKSVRRASSIASWLYQVAFRTALRAAKKRHRRQTALIREEATVEDDPLEKIHAQSLQKALHEELSQLPDTYRAPLVICYLENKTRQEAAAELESTDASVKARLARGKRMLRLRLARRGVALTSALAVTTASIAEAAQLFSPQLVNSTVSICAAGVAQGRLPTADCSAEVISLVKEGTQAMYYSMMVKTAVAACIVSAVCLTWSLHADDVGGGAGATGAETVEFDAVTQRGPEASQDVHLLGFGLAEVQSESVPGLGAEIDGRAENNSDDELPETQTGSFELARERLRIRERYLLQKADAYELLQEAMREKSRHATSKADALETMGRARLYGAEADQFKGQAKLARQEMKLLQAVPTRGGPLDARIGRTASGISDSAGWQPTIRSPQQSANWDTIQPGHQLQIEVLGTTPDRPITGLYYVEPRGTVPMGPGFGRVNLLGLSLEEAEEKVKEHLKKWLSHPEVQITFGNATYQRNSNIRGRDNYGDAF